MPAGASWNRFYTDKQDCLCVCVDLRWDVQSLMNGLRALGSTSLLVSIISSDVRSEFTGHPRLINATQVMIFGLNFWVSGLLNNLCLNQVYNLPVQLQSTTVLCQCELHGVTTSTL